METVIEATIGLYHSNDMAAFDQSERRSAFTARILTCVDRTFTAIGAGSQTQEVVFWNLFVTKNVGRNEVVDKPTAFMEGIRDIYGEAGAVVFEYKLIKEVRQEFGVPAAFDKKSSEPRGFADLVRAVAFVALG